MKDQEKNKQYALKVLREKEREELGEEKYIDLKMVKLKNTDKWYSK